ncbi:hypothetical protein ASF32_03680 [Methylobacterium sp. Leaf91]|nr:hypothetical protein ASF32_03680 [Methylobacterium sp. Leaf91]
MTEIAMPSLQGAAELCLNPRFRKPRFNPVEASDYLAQVHGTPVAIATLAKMRCLGGGPSFDRFGRSIFYSRADLDAWVSGRMTGTRRSTSDQSAR